MKGLGKKRTFGPKMEFLRYSIGEFSMIVGSFYFRPMVKILSFQFTISLSVVEGPHHFPGNFSEISGKIPGKFPRMLQEISGHPGGIPHTHTHPSPYTHNHILPLYSSPSQSLKLIFLEIPFFIQTCVFYPTPSNAKVYYYKHFSNIIKMVLQK